MSLITEDGTGLINAESYVTVAESLIYHANRGNDTWATITTSQQEQALRRATDYMEEVYRLRWAGFRVNFTQALDWPRYLVPKLDSPGGYTGNVSGWLVSYYLNNTVPDEVKKGCMELAIKAAAGDLSPDLARATTSEKVGEIVVTYQAGNRQYVKYRSVDNLLAPVLKFGPSMSRVLRAGPRSTQGFKRLPIDC